MLLLLLTTVTALATAQDCGVKPEQRPWTEPQADPETRIVAGRDAVPGSWPWQLSLQYLKDNGTWGHTCGSVLLNSDWVLTAAHCTHGRADPERFRIVAGAWDIKLDTEFQQTVGISQIFNHEGFLMFPPYPYDIGLLRLNGSVDLTPENVGVVCLPEPDADFAHDAAQCWITGWGLTNWQEETIPAILQEAFVVVPTNAECAAMGYDVLLLDSQICAGDGKPNACSGDSGGPMSCYQNGTWYVAGVTSFGPVFCAGLPAVYTRISSYLDWINDTIAQNP